MPDTLDPALLSIPGRLAQAYARDAEVRACCHHYLVSPGLVPTQVSNRSQLAPRTIAAAGGRRLRCHSWHAGVERRRGLVACQQQSAQEQRRVFRLQCACPAKCDSSCPSLLCRVLRRAPPARPRAWRWCGRSPGTRLATTRSGTPCCRCGEVQRRSLWPVGCSMPCARVGSPGGTGGPGSHCALVASTPRLPVPVPATCAGAALQGAAVAARGGAAGRAGAPGQAQQGEGLFSLCLGVGA